MRRVLLLILPTLLMVGVAWAGGPISHAPFTVSGTVDVNYPGTVTTGWNFDSAVGGTYASDYGTSHTMTVNGTPTLISGDGTWPNGLSGTAGKAWHFSGADYLNRSDDGSFDPSSDLSAQFVFTPTTVSGTYYIVSKWNAGGNQRGWTIYQNDDDIVFSTSVDGTVVTSVTAATVLAAYRPAFVTVTYDEATTTGKIYVDNQATASSGAMSASIHDSTADLVVGGSHGGGDLLEGYLHNLLIWVGLDASEAAHDQMFQSFQGRLSTTNVPISIASASPPAIMQKDCATADGCFIDQPANSSTISIHGHNGEANSTSKWWRGSCEACDGANHCTGWTIAENLGGGAATVVVDCSTTTSAHGGTSILFTADGGAVPKYAEARGACQVGWIGQDVQLFAWGKTLTGTADCDLRLQEYDNADCTGWLASTLAWNGDPGASWSELSGGIAAAGWNGATSSWYPMVRCNATGTAYTAVFDFAQAYQQPSTWASNAGCCTDADADAVCTNIAASMPNPLGADTWTITGTWQGPEDGATASTKQIIHVPATAGNSNQIDVTHAADVLTCTVNDSAGNARTSTVAAASAASESWDFKIYHTNSETGPASGVFGRVGCCAKLSSAASWTCDATEGTQALTDGIHGTIYYANTAGAGSNLSVSNIRTYRSLLP